MVRSEPGHESEHDVDEEAYGPAASVGLCAYEEREVGVEVGGVDGVGLGLRLLCAL